MKKRDRDNVLKLTISVLLVVFGIILLIDQLDNGNPFVQFVDDLFSPWFTIVILFIAACLLAHAIIKKAPIMYVLSMFFAGLFLMISVGNKVESKYVGAAIFILPMFVGIGLVLADRICKWSPKVLRFGVVLTVASVVVMVSVILEVWRYVIPIVVVLIGIAYFIFGLFAMKQDIVEEKDDHYVTYEPKKKAETDDHYVTYQPKSSESEEKTTADSDENTVQPTDNDEK